MHIANDLSMHLEENPTEYAVAIQSFIKSYKSITTDSHRLSALHTFSKFKSSLTAHTCLKWGVSCLQTSTQIGVQPSSVARRRLCLGGRRRLTVGRPPKTTFTEQHAYAKQPTQLCHSSSIEEEVCRPSQFTTLCDTKHLSWKEALKV